MDRLKIGWRVAVVLGIVWLMVLLNGAVAWNAVTELGAQWASSTQSAAVADAVGRAQGHLLAICMTALGLVVGLGYVLARSVVTPLGEAARVAQRVAGGDLTGAIEPRGRDETAELMRALNVMKEELAGIAREVRDAALCVASASGEITRGNGDLSRRTEAQAASLEETAASMEELTATVRRNADSSRQAQQLVERAHASAVRAAEIASRAIGSMDEIGRSSKEIAGIIGVIDAMAFQTNLLALNAAVEAARAGEHGRGFAVVAAEVRSLAGRSAQAAREIKDLVGRSGAAAQEGESSVEQCAEVLSEVLGAVKEVQAIAGEIALASREQAGGIEQVNKAVIQMDEMTQKNAALVEESTAAAEALDEMAQTLKRAVGAFKLDAAGGGLSRPGAGGAGGPRALRLPR